MPENSIHFTNSLNATYCSMWYLEHNKMISIVWKGTAPADNVRKVKESLLDLIKGKDCQAIMNDVQQFFSAPADLLRDLGATEWDAEVSHLGVKYLVHVLNESTPIPTETDEPGPGGLIIKHFHHKMDALGWIKQHISD